MKNATSSKLITYFVPEANLFVIGNFSPATDQFLIDVFNPSDPNDRHVLRSLYAAIGNLLALDDTQNEVKRNSDLVNNGFDVNAIVSRIGKGDPDSDIDSFINNLFDGEEDGQG